MKKKTDWSGLQRDSTAKAHASEIAALRQQLDHATAQIERMENAKRAKIILATPSRKRDSGDVVRVIIPDTHGAKMSVAAAAAMLSDIKAINPQEVIMLGDHVDCGGFLAQHHVMGYVAETAYSYEDDIAAANGFLDSLRSAAPSAKIEYIEGNHERRVEQWAVTMTLRHSRDAEGLRKLYAPEFRLNLKERGVTYYRDSVCYDGLGLPGVIKRGKCYFFHGFSTSKNATASTVEKIAGNCVFGHCFSEDTQVLTRAGWKYFNELVVGQHALTVSLKGGVSQWQPIKDVFSHDTFKELCHFNTPSLDVAVTKDHAMVVVSNGGKIKNTQNVRNLKRVEASELVTPKRAPFQIPQGGNNPLPDFDIPDTDLKFLAWVITEGHISERNGVARYLRIAQSEKPKVGIRRITDLCDKLGLKYTVSKRYSAGTTEHGTHRRFDAFRINVNRGGKDGESGIKMDSLLSLIPCKTIQPWMMDLSKRQFDVLLHELILGDGYVNKSAKHSMQYCTNKIKEADLLQALCALNGYRATVSKRPLQPSRSTHKPCYTVTINTRGIAHVDSRSAAISVKPYSGTVWCCSVDNQTLVTRRNGKVAVCGNTHRAQSFIVRKANVGVIGAWNPGCLTELQPLWQHTNPTEWTHGYGIQLVHGDDFLHLNIPIIDNKSLFAALVKL